MADEIKKGVNQDRAFLTVIEDPRACAKICLYRPGKSPEQHEQIEVEMERESQTSEAASMAEEKAERQHREEMIYRIREARRQRDWQDTKDADQRHHEKSIAEIQDRKDDKQFRRDIFRMILSGVGVVVMFFLGQAVGSCGKTTANTQAATSEPAK